MQRWSIGGVADVLKWSSRLSRIIGDVGYLLSWLDARQYDSCPRRQM